MSRLWPELVVIGSFFGVIYGAWEMWKYTFKDDVRRLRDQRQRRRAARRS